MDDTTKAEIRQKLGNVSHLQELLFGEQIEEYDRKLAQYDQQINRLELNYQELKLATEERLKQIENKLLHQLSLVNSSLEKKVKYSLSTAKEEQLKIRQELDAVTQNNYSNFDFLENSINSQNHRLKSEIIHSKAELEQDLHLLKKQLSEQLELKLTRLASSNVSRNDLAEVLFELCVQLKEPESKIADTIPPKQLDQGNESRNNASQKNGNLILPEQS